MIRDQSKNWNVQFKICDYYMTLTIDSSEKFSQDEISLIVKIISDNELFRFEKLRDLGYCSGYNLSDSYPKHLEFNWLNINSIRPPKDSIYKFNETCSCTTCRIRFDN